MQNQPVVTACNCTGEPRSILDEAGQPMLVDGVVVCPHCGRNPFGYTEAAPVLEKAWHALSAIPYEVQYKTLLEHSAKFLDLPDSEGGEI